MTDKKTAKTPPSRAGDDSMSLAPRRAGLEGLFEEFFRPFDQLFQPILPGATQSFPWGGAGSSQPILDLKDRGDHYSLTAELPGFTKDEVEVRVDSDGVELKADRSEKESKGEDGSYSRSTRSYYQYVSLPDQVLTEKVGGTMKNGILELKLPKRSPRLADARRVDLK